MTDPAGNTGAGGGETLASLKDQLKGYVKAWAFWPTTCNKTTSGKIARSRLILSRPGVRSSVLKLTWSNRSSTRWANVAGHLNSAVAALRESIALTNNWIRKA